MEELLGKVALVTGGARGIGRATALRLARSGADIAINYVTSDGAAREVAQAIIDLGRKAIAVKADIGEEDDLAQMVEMVREQFGRCDILISNAASGGFRNVMNANARHFDAAMRTNARALMLLAQLVVPMMRASGGGKIVAVSSHGSIRALPSYGVIGASKAALESLVRHLAFELGPHGINCNCVMAGLVATDSTKVVPQELFDAVQQRMLVPRDERLLPEHVADAIHFLVGPASKLVQGHTLVIDGGVSLHG